MKYKAFGFIIDSEIVLSQLQIADGNEVADIKVCLRKLSETGLSFEPVYQDEREFRMCPKGIANFRVTDRHLIEVEPLMDTAMEHIGVYILGSCMGAIIHQRELFPMHGSCVTDGEHSILISGDSGAGKSTLASEFLRRGWKLLTDDVAIVEGIEEKKPMVRSSYPSQKLWQDSLDRYNYNDQNVHSLYSRGDELKYGVNVSDMFLEGCKPLSLVVRLIAVDDYDTEVQIVEGFGKVEEIRRNTYRSSMVFNHNLYFQRVVTLGSILPMALALRKKGEDSAALLYDKITAILNSLVKEDEMQDA